jgi:hypothetical protein
MKQAVFEAFSVMAVTKKPPGHTQMSVCLNKKGEGKGKDKGVP